MLVKLDENLGRSHREFLETHGYHVDTVREEGLSGAPDAELWDRVVQEGRFFITLDLDFSDVRKFRPGTHPGILLLRPSRNSRRAVQRVLGRVVLGRSLKELEGCLAVADDRKTRVRRPPSGA
ncbi:MAG: DUF5615 family PIN-like protein [Acidobacteria bacterium]|nr:DUF5615 family PIN-like protein [Acidobacteriota bacterium]